MSGKCRASLRRKTLENLELCAKLHQISITDYECVKAAFDKLGEYENSPKNQGCEFCKDGISFIGAELIIGNDSRFHPINYCLNCGARLKKVKQQ